MRRRSLFLTLLTTTLSIAIGVAPPAATALTSPAEVPLRVASPSDDVAHPGSYTEWWYASVINPATGETFIANQLANPVPTSVSFWYDRSGHKAHTSTPTTAVVTDSRPSIKSNAEHLYYDAERAAYHLTYSFNGISADIWFDNAKPGVTWGPLNYDDQTMSWTVPVATSTVSGWVWPAGYAEPISVDGWRGYHDHNWGDFDLGNQDYTGWEWGISHRSDGTAELMGGVIDSAGRWHGVQAGAGNGTSFCRSSDLVSASTAVSLSNWATYDGFTYPKTVTTRCTDGGNVGPFTYSVTDPYVVDQGLFSFTEAVGHTTPGSAALIEHFRSRSHYGS